MSEALAQRINATFGEGCLALGLGLGAELGLFKLMADLDRPFSSEDLARAGGFKERYIREWLSAMACSRIIEFDTENELFSVSREDLACLTSEVPLVSGLLAIFGEKQPLLKDCFKLDGPRGIDQSTPPGFGIWLDSVRGRKFEHAIENIVLSIPEVREKLESGITVADVGCGVGQMAMLLADRFPNSTVWALDIDTELLETGRQRAEKRKLENLHFERTDLQQVSETMTAKFDYIFCYDVIHDMPSPKTALEGIHKMLKEGGVFSMVEPKAHSSLKDNMDDPKSTANYVKSLYLCVPHSLNTPGGEGWGRQMGEEKGREFLVQAGFTKSTIIKVGKIERNHFICHK